MTSRRALALAGAALLSLPAVAQTTGTSPGSSPPTTAQPSDHSTSSTTSSGTNASDTKQSSDTKAALTEMKPGQWRATKLTGVNVYDNNKAKIGDVSELIVNRDGKIEAVVVGVGGFLGMGQHDVAIPFEQVQWVDTPPDNNRASGSSSSAPATGTGSGSSATGSSGTGTSSAGNDTSTRSGANAENRGYPDHAVVSMTKDQLKALPEVHYGR